MNARGQTPPNPGIFEDVKIFLGRQFSLKQERWHNSPNISLEIKLRSTNSLRNSTCVSRSPDASLQAQTDLGFRSSYLIVMVGVKWLDTAIKANNLAGVLWSGDHLFPGTVETLELLRSKGSRIPRCPDNSLTSSRQASGFCHK